MSGYFIKAILLDGCPYSQSAHQLLKIHHIPSKIITVNQDNKAIYKTENINTFRLLFHTKTKPFHNFLVENRNDLFQHKLDFF